MNHQRLPGLLVRLRASAPFRFGPDSGAPDRVDRVCHSDTLYSALCAAMRDVGQFEAFVEATAAGPESALSFSSCFPWQDDMLFVAPPAGLWPPPASGKVRWKGAKFVPLSLIPGLLEGKPVDEERWVVDGSSGCLLPLNRRSPYGPYRISMRTGAAVDRLSPGACDVYSTACLEFSENSGLWCAVAFAGEAARNRWIGPLRAAFRLLADSGIGGERSRGWGRSMEPRFHEGPLPDLLLAPARKKQGPKQVAEEPGAEPAEAAASVLEPAPVQPLALDREDTPAERPVEAAGVDLSEAPPAPAEDASAGTENGERAEAPSALAVSPPEPPSPAAEPGEPAPVPAADADAGAGGPSTETVSGAADETQDAGEVAQSSIPEPVEAAAVDQPPTMPVEESAMTEAPQSVDPQEAIPVPAADAPGKGTAWWLLSLFNPAASDAVDWKRGSYALVTRGGRIESPVRAGELKKTIRMVAEGSVLVAADAPKGRAADVAPEGFPHPVYRAGFAFTIPIPWRED
ncbi:MAG: hypothetical protein SFV54_24180 [Bryobacteraceae bacterium]|nr:hypothetical protein [Bryobacteraceae bacterium]